MTEPKIEFTKAEVVLGKVMTCVAWGSVLSVATPVLMLAALVHAKHKPEERKR